MIKNHKILKQLEEFNMCEIISQKISKEQNLSNRGINDIASIIKNNAITIKQLKLITGQFSSTFYTTLNNDKANNTIKMRGISQRSVTVFYDHKSNVKRSNLQAQEKTSYVAFFFQYKGLKVGNFVFDEDKLAFDVATNERQIMPLVCIYVDRNTIENIDLSFYENYILCVCVDIRFENEVMESLYRKEFNHFFIFIFDDLNQVFMPYIFDFVSEEKNLINDKSINDYEEVIHMVDPVIVENIDKYY